MLITTLLEEEALFKKKILENLSLVDIELFMDYSSIEKDNILPFSAFTLTLYEILTDVIKEDDEDANSGKIHLKESFTS